MTTSDQVRAILAGWEEYVLELERELTERAIELNRDQQRVLEHKERCNRLREMIQKAEEKA